MNGFLSVDLMSCCQRDVLRGTHSFLLESMEIFWHILNSFPLSLKIMCYFGDQMGEHLVEQKHINSFKNDLIQHRFMYLNESSQSI